MCGSLLAFGRARQGEPLALVVHDRALVDLRETVISRVGQGSSVRPQFDMAFGVLGHLDVAMKALAASMVLILCRRSFLPSGAGPRANQPSL